MARSWYLYDLQRSARQLRPSERERVRRAWAGDAHAPDAVHRVVVHAQLRLPPQGVAKLVPPQSQDDAQHAVLDVGPHDDDLHVLQAHRLGHSGQWRLTVGVHARLNRQENTIEIGADGLAGA